MSTDKSPPSPTFLLSGERGKQRGVALILVLLIVALCTTLAGYIAQQQSLWQRQIEAQFDHAQARRSGVAAVDWARAVLADDARSGTVDHEGEIWAMRLPPIPLDNGEIVGTIEDQQGLLNLNNLVRDGVSSAPDVAQFQRLLGLLGLPPELAVALADWIDADSEAQYPNGAEDMYYLSQPTPYRTANRPLVELGELMGVRGFNAQIIQRLRPYVSVLPVRGAVNVNFATAEVLAAAIDGLSLGDARLLVQRRKGNPFKDIADFKLRLPVGMGIAEENLSVSSQFFWVSGRATVGGAQLTTRALLQRFGGWPTVVWQSVE
jgi:general secretion pathway protein K